MIVFDGHTHIYDCYDLDTFFLAAFQNFSGIVQQLNREEPAKYFLLMAEATGVYYFKKLKSMAGEGVTNTGGPWRVEQGEESFSLEVYHDSFPAMTISLVAGRQLITAEKLELLALMSEEDFEDGLDLATTVDAVIQGGAIPVCPWGAGKWMCDRGKTLENYLKIAKPQFLLGDSGGRPTFWRRPALFEDPSISARVLSGSDPLPLKGEEGRVGSFGGIVEGPYPEEKGATFLRDLLKEPATKISPYGRSCGATLFVKNQLALRLN